MDQVRSIADEFAKRGDYEGRLLAEVLRAAKPSSLQAQMTHLKPGTNAAAAPSLFFAPGTEVREFPQSLNANGFVLGRLPRTAFIGPGEGVNTRAHEAAHVQQNMAGMPRTGPSYIDRSSSGEARLKTFKETAGVRGMPQNAHASDRELLASLQGHEAELPEGGNVMDVEPWNAVLATPKLRRMYESSMYPLHDKVFPSDANLSGGGIGPDAIDGARRWIRNVTAPEIPSNSGEQANEPSIADRFKQWMDEAQQSTHGVVQPMFARFDQSVKAATDAAMAQELEEARQMEVMRQNTAAAMDDFRGRVKTFRWPWQQPGPSRQAASE